MSVPVPPNFLVQRTFPLLSNLVTNPSESPELDNEVPPKETVPLKYPVISESPFPKTVDP